MKISTFAKAPTGEGREAFQDWFVEEFARTVVRQAPTIVGCVVRRVIPPPPATPDAWIIDPGSDFFDFDVLMETWFPTEEDYRREVLGTEMLLRDRSASFASFSVASTLQKDPRIAEAGVDGKRPEITFINPVVWKPGVPREELIRHYNEHGPIALRTQRAFTKYEQHVVVNRISWTQGVPLLDIYSDFSFRLAKDQTEKMISTGEEFHDIIDFVGKYWAVWLSDAEPVPVPF